MSRIAIPAPEHAPAAAQPLLAAVHQQLGMVPNLMKMVANSPAALEGYLSLSAATAKGVLDLGTRESIALASAEFNHCDYCLAAHSYLGKNLAKLSDEAIALARQARAADASTDAALRFAQQVLHKRGMVSDEEVAAVRAAGFGDAAVVEIVTQVALNILTNYLNNVAATDLDFPAAATLA